MPLDPHLRFSDPTYFSEVRERNTKPILRDLSFSLTIFGDRGSLDEIRKYVQAFIPGASTTWGSRHVPEPYNPGGSMRETTLVCDLPDMLAYERMSTLADATSLSPFST